MTKSKVIARQLTNKGLLISFDNNTTAILSKEKLEIMNLMGFKAPNINDEVSIKPSTDAAGNASTQWSDLVI